MKRDSKVRDKARVEVSRIRNISIDKWEKIVALGEVIEQYSQDRDQMVGQLSGGRWMSTVVRYDGRLWCADGYGEANAAYVALTELRQD